MLTLELISVTQNKVSYRIFPEGTFSNGIIESNLGNEFNFSFKNAETIDSKYKNKAITLLRRMFKNNNFPDSEMIAWY